MKKTIVLYYSKTGNNEFIAKKLAKEIQADLEQIEAL
jgi:flavodoxin